MKRTIGLLAMMAGLASAGTITLQSGVSGGESNNITGINYVIPGLEPVWVPNRPDGASWISFENTGWQVVAGVGGAVITLQNATAGHPNATFTQTFTDTAGTQLSGSLTVWADDTVAVFLDGVQLVTPNYSQAQGVNCSPIGVTCTDGGVMVDFTASPGTHTFTFDVYQTGAWTYGLMYDGSVSDNATAPEPGSYILLGTGLAALGFIGRKWKKV